MRKKIKKMILNKIGSDRADFLRFGEVSRFNLMIFNLSRFMV